MRTVLVLALSGCAQIIQLDEELPARSIVEACDAVEPTRVTLDVHFPKRGPGCEWGEDGNLEPAQGLITARTEDLVALDMPSGVALCDVSFDFQGPDPEGEQILRYDDSFLLTLDEVVLVASYGPAVDAFAQDGHLRLYDWERLAGTPFTLEESEVYCLGAAEGLSTCTVPPPETEGVIALEYDAEIIEQLADYAFREQRYAFTFVTVGDNDAALDCSHTEFQFAVDVAYVPYVAYEAP
jgi:hypothetical protein